MPAGLREIHRVTFLRLDTTDEGCVREAAAAVGSEIDILINTADVPRAGSGSQTDSEVARSEMETHYFGLLNLARYFTPAMITRAAHTQRLCPAWVTAAAHALSQCMREQLREAGIRLVTVFPGPLENERGQVLQQPQLPPAVLAKSIVDALRRGVEEVYPGDVAREWFDGMLDRRTVPNRVDPLTR
jgi:NAD(P)-dependent dehydrogenase (short-subunit alcohol dehydrogenase family)